jgi:four helix bundle protein
MPQYLPQDIRERTFQFACAIVRFCNKLSTAPGAARQIAYQLLNAGTSVDANVEEAKAAYSKREFISKNSIALKEARETLFWLRVIASCFFLLTSHLSRFLEPYCLEHSDESGTGRSARSGTTFGHPHRPS